MSPCPPSWGISVDRPLISGRKQGPVTRSGGRGNTQGFGHREPWGGELSGTQAQGLTPSQPGSSLSPSSIPGGSTSPWPSQALPGQASARGYSAWPLAAGRGDGPCSAPSLSEALFWLPSSHVQTRTPPGSRDFWVSVPPLRLSDCLSGPLGFCRRHGASSWHPPLSRGLQTLCLPVLGVGSLLSFRVCPSAPSGAPSLLMSLHLHGSVSVFRSLRVSVCLWRVCLSICPSVWNWASICESALGRPASGLRPFGLSVWLTVQGGDEVGSDLWTGPGMVERRGRGPWR